MPGDRIGIWAPNRYEWVVTQFATAKAGLILVTINPAYRTSELEYALNKVGCKALVLAPSFKTSDYAAMLEQVRSKVPTLRAAILTDDAPRAGLSPLRGRGVVRDRRRISIACASCAPQLQPEDAINIQFTSGTTGPAEGRDAVSSQHRQQRLLRRAAHDVHRERPPVHSRAAVSLLRHGDGRARLRDATALRWCFPGEAFEPKSVLEALEAERCTALFGVPTMFIAELEHPEFKRYDLRTLRTGVMAGAPCPWKS